MSYSDFNALFSRCEIAAPRGISLNPGEIEQPIGKTSPGILDRGAKERLYHFWVLSGHVLSEGITSLQVIEQYTAAIYFAVEPPFIRDYSWRRTPTHGDVIARPHFSG